MSRTNGAQEPECSTARPARKKSYASSSTHLSGGGNGRAIRITDIFGNFVVLSPFIDAVDGPVPDIDLRVNQRQTIPHRIVVQQLDPLQHFQLLGMRNAVLVVSVGL